MFRKEAFPFLAGIATGIGFAAMFMFYVEKSRTPEFDIMDHPRAQIVSATAMTKDAVTVKVSVTIRTKENLSTRYMEQDSKHFIREVVSKYFYKQQDEMLEKFKSDTVKFLGLPCSAMFMNIAISGNPNE